MTLVNITPPMKIIANYAQLLCEYKNDMEQMKDQCGVAVCR